LNLFQVITKKDQEFAFTSLGQLASRLNGEERIQSAKQDANARDDVRPKVDATHRKEKANGLLSRLAKRAGAAATTVSRFEDGSGVMVDILARIQGALESAGVIFIAADHTGGPEVRLRDAPAAKAERKRSG
jgi:hypothetical protein